MTCTCGHPRAQHLELTGACTDHGEDRFSTNGPPCTCHLFTPAPGPPVTFAYYNTGAKVACSVCGVAGYNGGRWQMSHRRGHLPCASGCGTLLTVKLDGTARHHNRWPCPTPGEPDA